MVPGQIRAVKVQGNVWQITKASGQRERLNEGDFFRQGNVIETAANGSAVLLFDNGSTIDLRPSTKFSIDEFLVEPFDREKVDYRRLRSEPSKSVTGIRVNDGTITAKVAKLNRASAFNISTPVGTAGIRGTVVTVSVNPNAATFVVTEGMIQVTKNGKTYWVSQGADQGQQGDTRTGRQGSEQEQTVIISENQNYTPPPGQVQNLAQQGQQFSQTANQMIPDKPFSGAPADNNGGGRGGEGGGEGGGESGEGGGGGGSGGGAPPAMPGGFGGGGGGGGGGSSGGGSQYSNR